MFDSFETQIQPEEIIPEEYEDWLNFLAKTWAPGGCEWEEDEATEEFEPGRIYWNEMAANP